MSRHKSNSLINRMNLRPIMLSCLALVTLILTHCHRTDIWDMPSGTKPGIRTPTPNPLAYPINR